MWSEEDVKELDGYNKGELIRMYLALKEDYASQHRLVVSLTEDIESLQEIAIKYLNEKIEMRKEIWRLKGKTNEKLY